MFHRENSERVSHAAARGGKGQYRADMFHSPYFSRAENDASITQISIIIFRMKSASVPLGLDAESLRECGKISECRRENMGSLSQ